MNTTKKRFFFITFFVLSFGGFVWSVPTMTSITTNHNDFDWQTSPTYTITTGDAIAGGGGSTGWFIVEFSQTGNVGYWWEVYRNGERIAGSSSTPAFDDFDIDVTGSVGDEFYLRLAAGLCPCLGNEVPCGSATLRLTY